jgi:hypothetical protein
MALVALSIVIYTSMFFYFTMENRKRDRGERDGITEGLTQEEILALGDENPAFRFAR